MKKLIVKNSRRKYLAFAFLQILMAAFFLLPFTRITGKTHIIFAVMASIFTLGSLFFVWCAFDSNPKIIIDDEGIWADTFSLEKIFWQDIAEIKLDNGFLALKLKNFEKNHPSNPLKASKSFNKRFIAYIRFKDTKTQVILSFISRRCDEILNSNFTK